IYALGRLLLLSSPSFMLLSSPSFMLFNDEDGVGDMSLLSK
ncbi:unnamed protein product, partial [Rotaria sp. Silwood2]